ncbi:MAG: hypothetical protein ABGZ23_02060 [Fuerstiella sp.]
MSATKSQESVGRWQSMPRRNFIIGCVCGSTIVLALGYFTVRWQVMTSAATTIRQAELHVRSGDHSGAREILATLMWFEPSHHQGLLIRGISLNADRMFAESIAALEQIPVESPSYEDAGTTLVSSLIHDGWLERAEAVLIQHLGRFPQSAQSRENLVRLYLSQLRGRAAMAVLQDYQRAYPEDLSVLPHMLDLEAKILTANDRVRSLETADMRHPRQAAVILALARAYAMLGMTEHARSRFQAALDLKPRDPVTRIHAAEFQFECGDAAAARHLLQMDTAAQPENDDRYLFLLCRMAAKSNEIAQSYAHLQKAMALRPHEETYVLMQSALLRHMGRADEAAAVGQEAVHLAEARKRLMVLSDQLDRRQPAAPQCAEIAELLEQLGHPGQATGWRRVARAVVP